MLNVRFYSTSSGPPACAVASLTVWQAIYQLCYFYFRDISRLMLRGKIICVYSESHTKHIIHCVTKCGVFRRVRKIAKSDFSFTVADHPNETTRHPLDGFPLTLMFEYFLKSVENVKVSLQSNKNSEDFMWGPVMFFDHILLSSYWNEKRFRQTLWRKSRHILCSITFFPLK